MNDQSQSLPARKAELRASAKRIRAAAAAEVPEAASRLRERFLGSVPLPEGAPVSGYWAVGAEIDPGPLIALLHGRGHAIGLPVVIEKGAALRFRRWRPGDRLEAASLGIPVPLEDQPELRPGLLIVPLLAFDRAGYRLGYGGGFYDRTLAGLRGEAPPGARPLAVGVAFGDQEVTAVPRDASDQRLDWIVTEREAIAVI